MATAVWFSALRPKTLPAAAIPVLVGGAHSWHSSMDASVGASEANFLAGAAALAGALLIQIGTNLANDYYDYKKGADTPDRAGPVRASAAGLIEPRKVRNAAVAAFTLAALLGIYLTFASGWPILVVGAAAILSGWFYTAGPRPLAYIGLGDLFVLLFFGPVAVMGTTYVMLPHDFDIVGVWMPALFIGIQVGAISTAILVVNNLRDLPTDARVGKRTLAVRIGERGTRIQYTLLLGLAFLLSVMAYQRHHEWRMLIPLASLPMAVLLILQVWRPFPDRSRLNRTLAGTAGLLTLFGILMVVSLVIP